MIVYPGSPDLELSFVDPHLYSHPVLLVLATFAISCLFVYGTDGLALPRNQVRIHRIRRSASQAAREMLARLPIIALVYAGFFAFSWRPFYALQATSSFFIIFTGISRAKFIYIREPLIFSDIALVVAVFKHKEIFYATFINILFWVVALGYVFGASALYMWFEPTVLPHHAWFWWLCLGAVLAIAPWSLPFLKLTNPSIVRFSEATLKTLDPVSNTIRFGAFASVTYHFIIWMGRKRETVVEEIRLSLQHLFLELTGLEQEEQDDGPPLIVVWQSESFLDLRHFQVEDLDLPHLDHLRRRACQWGRMTNVFEGGYTLRTEFAVLTGLQPEDAYVDASYPYLRASHYADIAWPNRFLKSGWLTHFMHPYDRTFFLRDKAMPQLGFAEMTMLDAFDHLPERDGQYVSDRRLTQKLIEAMEASNSRQPSFFFTASMANHGPWEAGRCGSLTDPVEIYKELLRKADDALGFLTAYLDGLHRPVWLLFYGDHAPLLKAFADPFPDARTDYIIVPLGTAHHPEAKPVAPQEEAPWKLLGSLFTHASFKRNRDA